MNAEVITIGDELLIGQTIDTNSAWIGQTLSEIGISISRRTAVADASADIKAAINEAFSRTDIVFVTGGLGPTKDDITKKTLCEYYNTGLRLDEAVLAELKSIFERRGRTMMENNAQQAMLPANCITLFNEVGTAPGMLFNENGKVLISMPGVPNEMKFIITKHVIPYLKANFDLPAIIHKTMVVVNVPESVLSNRLDTFENSLPAHIKLAYLPALNTLRLRLSGKLNDRKLLEEQMGHFWGILLNYIGKDLGAESDITMAEECAKILMAKKRTLSTAESCTGGSIAHTFTLTPGISSVYIGGIVSYHNDMKLKYLGVEQKTIQTQGVVSEEAVTQMLKGCLKKFDTDYAIATSGIAGPTGATETKPVGLVYIGVANKDKSIVKKWNFFGNRTQVIDRATNTAFSMLKKLIDEEL